MATDGATPPPCDEEIFQHGHSIAAVYGRSNAIERWVRAVAQKSRERVDWHMSGGYANVLYLGDESSHARVLDAIQELAPTLDGRIMMTFKHGQVGLWRNGVNDAQFGIDQSED